MERLLYHEKRGKLSYNVKYAIDDNWEGRIVESRVPIYGYWKFSSTCHSGRLASLPAPSQQPNPSAAAVGTLLSCIRQDWAYQNANYGPRLPSPVLPSNRLVCKSDVVLCPSTPSLPPSLGPPQL